MLCPFSLLRLLNLPRQTNSGMFLPVQKENSDFKECFIPLSDMNILSFGNGKRQSMINDSLVRWFDIGLTLVNEALMKELTFPSLFLVWLF